MSSVSGRKSYLISLYDSYDLKKNKKISLNDFIMFIKEFSFDSISEEGLIELFESETHKKDGYITKNQIFELIDSLIGGHIEFLKIYFRLVDKDSDSLINSNEIYLMTKSLKLSMELELINQLIITKGFNTDIKFNFPQVIDILFNLKVDSNIEVYQFLSNNSEKSSKCCYII